MGSVPLAALHINPPEQQPDPINRFAALMQLKQQQALIPAKLAQTQSDLQATNLANQEKAQQLKDQQALTAAYQKWDGKNPDDLGKLVTENGGSGNARIGVQKQFLALREQYSTIAKNDAETGSKNLETLKGKNDLVLGALKTADSVPDEQLGQHLAQTVQGLTQQGVLDPQHAQQAAQLIQGLQGGTIQPAQARQALSIFEKSLQSNSQQIDQATKEAQAAKDKSEADKNAAQMAYYQQHGGAPGVPVETQEMNDYLAKNPGKGPADFMAYKAKLVPQFNFNLQNAGTTGNAADVAKKFGYTPQAFDNLAENYWKTGQLPKTGRGGPSLAANKAIMNRANDLHAGESIVGNAEIQKANQKSLDNLQKQFDQVNAFENTAGKNLDVFLNTAKKVVDFNSPMVNKPLRSLSSSMIGSQDQAAFNAARTTAVTEIAKVLNSSNASGVLSDSARHEVEGLIGPDATLGQIYKAAGILKQDMANRHDAYQQQIDDLQGRLKKNAPQSEPQGGGKEIHYKIVDGKLVAQ